jgi:hypothetical protein
MTPAAIIFISAGAFLSALNWLCLLSSWRGRRHVSPVFPAPSLLTAIGLALIDRTRSYWWLGLLSDWTLFSLLAASRRLIVDAWNTSSFTRQRLLEAEDGPRRFTLSLHRGGRFLLRAAFEPPVSSNEHGALAVSFGEVGRWEETADGALRLWAYRENRELSLRPDASSYLTRESNYPREVPFPFDSLDGLRFNRNA